MKVSAKDMPYSYWRNKARKNGVCDSTWRSRRYYGWSLQRAAQPVDRDKFRVGYKSNPKGESKKRSTDHGGISTDA